MKVFQIRFPIAFLIVCCSMLLNTYQLKAQFTKTETVPFKLGSSNSNRTVYNMEITNPGDVVINASWKRASNPLALILNGPGQTGYYSRKDGKSPLQLEFKVTPELLKKGEKWTVSIVNFGDASLVIGRMRVEYPVGLNLENPTDLQIVEEEPSVVKDTLQRTGDSERTEEFQETGVKRRILENGTVELRYPDGTIKLIYNGGFTVIQPDGTVRSASYIQIPPTTPPQLPADERIGNYLNWQTESLLDLIKQILNYDNGSIENFLEHENKITQSVYEKMYIRTSYLNRLLSN